MRVVFVTHNYPRHGGDVAGAFLHPLAVALRRRGLDVRVVAPSDRGKGGDDELDGVPIRRVRYAAAANETFAYTGTMSDAMRSVQGLRALRSMISAMRRETLTALGDSGPRVVHAHWWVPAGMAVPSGARSVLTCHGTDVRLLAKGGPVQWFGRRVVARADVVTTVSRPFAETIAARTGVTVAPDAIQPMPVADLHRPASSGGGGLVVVGRLTLQKRVDLALRAYAALRARGMLLPLTIAGDGVAMHSLADLTRELGIDDHVTFLGAVAPADVPSVLARADCCLMTARDEGLGLAAAEALMQGVPVVACDDGGGVLDVVPRSGAGRVVAPEPNAIAGAVQSLMSDPTARQRALEAGAEWHERLSPDFVAGRAIAWYERALSE